MSIGLFLCRNLRNRLVAFRNSGLLGTLSVAASLGVVAFVAYAFANGGLYLGHYDASSWAVKLARLEEEGNFGFALSTDLSQGLGIWDYPFLLTSNLPGLIATFGSLSFSEPLFAASSVIALFSSSWYLARMFGLPRLSSDVAALVLACAVFMPSPFGWVSFVYHSSSPGWLLSLFSFSLAAGLSLQARLANQSGHVVKGAVVFVLFMLAMGFHGLLFAPFSFSLLALSLVTGALSTSISVTKRIRHAVLPLMLVVVTGGSFAWIFFRAVPLSLSFHTRGFSYSWATDPNNTIALLNYFVPALLNRHHAYKILLLCIAAAGVMWTGKQRSSSIVFLVLTAVLFAYTSVFSFGSTRGREVGPGPQYVGFFQLPILAVALVAALGPITQMALTLIKRWYGGSNRRLVLRKIHPSALVAIALFVWLAIWMVDNRQLREPRNDIGLIQRAVFPTAAAEFLKEQFSQASTDAWSDRQWGGRVLLLQDSEYGYVEGASDRIYPNPWLQSLRLQLVEAGVPVLNTYHHFETGRQVRLLRTAFSDGRPFLRSWTPLNHWGESSGIAASRLGVSFVVSQFPIKDPDLLEEFVTESERVYRVRSPNVEGRAVELVIGESSPEEQFNFLMAARAIQLPAVSMYEGRGLEQLAQADSSLTVGSDRIIVEVATTGRSLIVLPFEYSSCMKITSPNQTQASLHRVDYLLTGLLVFESGRYVITTSAQVWDSCIQQDHSRH